MQVQVLSSAPSESEGWLYGWPLFLHFRRGGIIKARKLAMKEFPISNADVKFQLSDGDLSSADLADLHNKLNTVLHNDNTFRLCALSHGELSILCGGSAPKGLTGDEEGMFVNINACIDGSFMVDGESVQPLKLCDSVLIPVSVDSRELKICWSVQYSNYSANSPCQVTISISINIVDCLKQIGDKHEKQRF